MACARHALMRIRTAFLLGLVASLAGCSDCEREGCEALQRPAPERGTGIAGVLAASSDVVENGCQECGFEANGSVAIWQVDSAVSTAAGASAVVAAADPVRASAPDGRFYVALAPGQYLLCSTPSCINVVVQADATTTVNVKRRYGPTSFFVLTPGSRRPVEDFGLEVGYEVSLQ